MHLTKQFRIVVGGASPVLSSNRGHKVKLFLLEPYDRHSENVKSINPDMRDAGNKGKYCETYLNCYPVSR